MTLKLLSHWICTNIPWQHLQKTQCDNCCFIRYILNVFPLHSRHFWACSHLPVLFLLFTCSTSPLSLPYLLWCTSNLQIHISLLTPYISGYSFLLGILSLCWSHKKTPGHHLWFSLNISYRIFPNLCLKDADALTLMPHTYFTNSNIYFPNSNYLTLFYYNVYISLCDYSSTDSKFLKGQNSIF